MGRKVFISYNETDRPWLERVVTHFQPFVRDGSIDLFCDIRIPPSTHWREKIAAELASAESAVLLVSPNFLASDFIVEEELPVFREAFEKRRQLKLYPLFLSPCAFGPYAFLEEIQGGNRPDEPLQAKSNTEQDLVLKELVKCVNKDFALSEPSVTARPPVSPPLRATGAELAATQPPDNSAGPSSEVAADIGCASQDLGRIPALPEGHVPREADVRRILKICESGLSQGKGPIVIPIWGMPGLGKTALGTEIAYAMRDQYPRQLYIDLNGYSDHPLTVEEAMQEVVSRTQCFKKPAKYPEIAEKYQNSLRAEDGGPLFLFLDNVQSNDQVVAPSNGHEISLIPEERHAIVLIMSRERILVRDAKPYPLDLFAPQQAIALLRKFVSEERADQTALEQIADLCGRLPLALHACGSFLQNDENWTVEELIDGQQEHNAVDEFGKAKQFLRAAVTRLVETRMDLFKRWVALAPFSGNFDEDAAATVLGLHPREATLVLSNLYRLSLLLQDQKSRRYEMHRLIRSIASEIIENPRLIDLEDPFQGEWQKHCNDAAYRHATYFCARLEDLEAQYLTADGERRAKTLESLHDDWSNIQQGFKEVASRIGKPLARRNSRPASLTPATRTCLSYVDAAPNLLYLRQSSSERCDWLETALRATKFLGHGRTKRQAKYLGALALAYYDQGDMRKARERQEEQINKLRQEKDKSSLASALGNLGCTEWALGDYAKAVRLFGEQFERAQEANDFSCVGYALFNIGAVLWGWCEPRRTPGETTRHLGIARAILEPAGLGAGHPQAHAVVQMLEDRHDIYQQEYKLASRMRNHERTLSAVNNLGLLFWAIGRTDNAIQWFEDLRQRQADTRDESALARTHNTLGLLYLATGDLDKASKRHRSACKVARDAGDYRGEGASLGNLGITMLLQGKPDDAKREHAEDLDLAQRIGNLHGIVVAYHNLGATQWITGHLSEALECHEAELAAARRAGDQIGICRASLEIGKVKLAEGNPDEARRTQEEAYEEAGELKIRAVIKIARAHLGNTYLRLGRVREAEHLFQANLVEETGPVRSSQARDFENMGKAKLKAGKLYCAIEYHRAALKIATEHEDAYRRCSILDNLGRVYRAASRFEEALDHHKLAYLSAKEASFGFHQSQAQDNTGICLVELGYFDDALDSLRSAYAEADRRGYGYRTQSILSHIGAALRRQGKQEEAMSALEKALEMNPSEHPYLAAGILRELALLLIETGDWRNGITKLEAGKHLLVQTGEPGARREAAQAEFTIATALVAQAENLLDPRLSQGRGHARDAVETLRSLNDPLVDRYADLLHAWCTDIDTHRRLPKVETGPVPLSDTLNQETLKKIEALLIREERDGEAFGLYTPEQMVGIRCELLEISAWLRRHRPERIRRADRVPKETPRFSESDTLCIAYVDHLRADDERLAAPRLRDFFNKHLDGAFSHLHVLPHFEYRSLDNGLTGPAGRADGGFEPKSYRMDKSYGTPGDLLDINASMMFDFVLNHLSVESPWFRGFLEDSEEYRGFFYEIRGEDTDIDLSQVFRPREHNPIIPFDNKRGRAKRLWCTFSRTQVDLNIQNPEVFKRLIRALVEDFIGNGASWIRLDAVGYLIKMLGRQGERKTNCFGIPETHNVIKVMNLFLRETAPSVSLVAEVNATEDVLNSYYGDRGDEAHMVYQFPIAPLSLLSIYTQDAGRMLSRAKSRCHLSGRIGLAFTSSHDGIGLSPLQDEPPVASGPAALDFMVEELKRRGAAINYRTSNLAGVPPAPYEACITWLQAILQGDELDHLNDDDLADNTLRRIADRFEASQMFSLTAPHCVPAEYLGALTGQLNDDELFRETKHNRDKNRGQIDGRAFEKALNNPETSYERLVQRIFLDRKRALRIRRSLPAFSPNAECHAGILNSSEDGRNPVYSLLRQPQGSDEFVLVLVNCTDSVQKVEIDRAALRSANVDRLKDILSSSPTFALSREGGFQISLEPYGTRWLIAQPEGKEDAVL